MDIVDVTVKVVIEAITAISGLIRLFGARSSCVAGIPVDHRDNDAGRPFAIASC
jgi:hypothetical protein